MTYTEKQIENAKANYTSFLQVRTVESFEPQYIGYSAAEQRCDFHNKIVSEILAGNKDLEKEWKLFFLKEEVKSDLLTILRHQKTTALIVFSVGEDVVIAADVLVDRHTWLLMSVSRLLAAIVPAVVLAVIVAMLAALKSMMRRFGIYQPVLMS
jgi:hypothetical protein